jgi:tight adherence protein B
VAGLAAAAVPGLALAWARWRPPCSARLLRARKRILRIESLLPDALDMMGRAMRAGHAFPTALKMVGEEIRAARREFRIVFDEVNFGVSMPMR